MKCHSNVLMKVQMVVSKWYC